MDERSSLDDILEDFTLFAPYHRDLFVYLFLAYLSNGITSSNYVFAVDELGYR